MVERKERKAEYLKGTDGSRVDEAERKERSGQLDRGGRVTVEWAESWSNQRASPYNGCCLKRSWEEEEEEQEEEEEREEEEEEREEVVVEERQDEQ